MTKLSLVFLFFCSLSATAQKRPGIDSIYYLIDTAKVPANARMWDIYEEYPSFKVYVIKCPCLQYDKEPSFIYDINKIKGQTISKKELKDFKFINLVALILKVKQFTERGFKGEYAIFLVEPTGKKYILHQVRLLKPTKSREVSIDYENISPPDSTKAGKP